MDREEFFAAANTSEQEVITTIKQMEMFSQKHNVSVLEYAIANFYAALRHRPIAKK